MIIKRDGKKESFSINKVIDSIEKAGTITEEQKNEIIKAININDLDDVNVIEIQNLIIRTLRNIGLKDIAKNYSEYRQERTRIREKKSDIMKTISAIGIETDRDNANVGNNFSAKLLRIASESNKWHMLAEMPKKFSKPHELGELYHHDLDSYNLTVNCLHLPTGELLKSGFNTGYGTINRPKRIEVAAELTCIMLQSSQNECFGGQSHPDFDNDMADFVQPTRDEITEKLNKLGINSQDIIAEELKRRVHQAMQAVIFNLNTMHSRGGAQIPFSSINIGLPKNEDAALVCKVFLEEYEKGLGKGEQPIFPNIIFRVKEGVNREKDDPYYYLYELACRVAAKRMNPTFMNIDADFNKEYYDKGYVPATMGCVDGKELVTYKYNNTLYVESFKRMRDRIITDYPNYKDGNCIPTTEMNLEIYDNNNGFVKVYNLIRNEDAGNWVKIKFNNGRTLIATDNHPLPIIDKGRTYVKDLKAGDKVPIVSSQYSESSDNSFSIQKAWLLGFILCDGCYESNLVSSIALESENDIEEYYKTAMSEVFNYDVETIERHRGVKGNYKDLKARGNNIKQTKEYLRNIFGGIQKIFRHIPNEIFRCNVEVRKAFLAGMLDADGYINPNTHGGSVIQLGSTNKELSLQTMALAQSLGYFSKVYENKYKKDSQNIRYRVEFVPNEDFINNYVVSEKKKSNFIPRRTAVNVPNYCEVKEIEVLGSLDEYSYDVETASDYFDVSGIYSHNCRTYLMKNINGEPGCKGRGNIAPCTINLVRIALEVKDIVDKSDKLNKFFDIFDERIKLAHDSLLYRYDVLKQLKAKDLPFLTKQKVIKGSENLSPDDSIEPILKQGTWGIGFIGLAETLVALVGKHHGESKEAKELGLKIISHLREKCDQYTLSDSLNWSCYATPAEGLSGKFIRQDKVLFGTIKGVTDKDYYTNSFHVPVSYKISIKDKIDTEAPYHSLCNGGHISYIEFDGNPTPEVIMKTLNYAYKNTNISYMGINFHIRYCKDCGTYLSSSDSICRCGSHNIQGISRVTGYLSLDERFGPGKEAERADRTDHNNNHERTYN